MLTNSRTRKPTYASWKTAALFWVASLLGVSIELRHPRAK